MAQGIVEQPSSQNSGQEQQGSGAAKAGPSRSQLVQRLLDQTASLPAFVETLLTAQAVTVAGTEAAGFLIERGQDESGKPAMGLRPLAHIRPDNSTPETRAAALQAFQDLVRPCVEKGKDGAIEVGQPNDQRHELQFCLITLLRSEGQVVAASAVVTRCMDTERARQRLMSMQLVAGYFELVTLRGDSEQSKMIAQSHQEVLQLATAVATADGFEAAANNLCNELATRSHASRVTLGWLKGRNMKVKALSHTEQFDKKQELVVQLEKAMEECHDQEEIVQYDPAGKSSENVTRAHAALSRAQGGGLVLSLPLRRKADIVGVITLEFLPNQQFGPHVAQGLSVAVELLAPHLYDRFQNDRWLITKAALSVKNVAAATIGPKHMLAKLVALLVIGLVAFSILYTPMYRVGAPFTFVGQADRVLSAPFDGYLGELGTIDGVKIKPGAVVKKGQLLVKMDTTELELERTKALKEAQRMAQQAAAYRGAKPTPKIAEAVVAELQREEALQDAALWEQKIARSHIRSPIDGVVLTGDLENMEGAQVEKGKPLFEVGPLEQLRVEMNVDERDIQEVELGQSGTIATTSLPTDKYDIEVERIVPLGEAKEGKNLFKVYGKLTGQRSPEWRPGMVGEARIDIREEPVWWIYSHRLVDFVKLKLWL